MDMIEPTDILLSADVLDTLSADEIIYSEFASAGAMGVVGGLMFYTIYGVQELHIERNKLSEAEKERIKKLLPNCVIYF